VTERVWNPVAQQFDAPPVTLAEFVLARVAEDGARARRAAEVPNGDALLAALPDDLFDGLRVAFPKRVEAECDAKLRILGLREGLARAIDNTDASGVGWIAVEASKLALQWLDDALKALALPYASHEQYRPEWRP
jgi:hypothetical protein